MLPTSTSNLVHKAAVSERQLVAGSVCEAGCQTAACRVPQPHRSSRGCVTSTTSDFRLLGNLKGVIYLLAERARKRRRKRRILWWTKGRERRLVWADDEFGCHPPLHPIGVGYFLH